MSEYTQLRNNLETLKLQRFSDNLDTYIESVAAGDKSFTTALYELTKEQIRYRQDIAERTMIKTAGFPFIKTLEDFDFSFQPSIKKDMVMSLKSMNFVENKENVLFVGSPGTGKTHLSVALGIESAINRYSTYFINCNDLIANLRKAKEENRLMVRLKHFASIAVLIIDEVGFLPIDEEDSNLFFQLIVARYEKHSTIITTNKPFSKWNEVFKNTTVAAAILDRLLHHSYIFKITGPSYRLKDVGNYIEDSESRACTRMLDGEIR